MNNKLMRYSPEVRERVVRMAFEFVSRVGGSIPAYGIAGNHSQRMCPYSASTTTHNLLCARRSTVSDDNSVGNMRNILGTTFAGPLSTQVAQVDYGAFLPAQDLQ